ncbi:MAG: hypothetical protein ABI169_06450 [Chitinophagaceae bacterium]
MLYLPSIPSPLFWILLISCFVLFIVMLKIMAGQSKHFKFQRGVAITSFSIMDLEFPGNEASICNIINGIHKLPEPANRDSLAALNGNLRADFLFMAAVYPFIALLCYHTAELMQHFGRWVFLILAVLQIVAWVFDILENKYLLHKIKHPYPAQPKRFQQYKKMVLTKWAFATTGLVTALSAHVYFWVTGLYGKFFYAFAIALLLFFAAIIIWKIMSARQAFFGKTSS